MAKAKISDTMRLFLRNVEAIRAAGNRPAYWQTRGVKPATIRSAYKHGYVGDLPGNWMGLTDKGREAIT
jgi:hypothetical protein